MVPAQSRWHWQAPNAVRFRLGGVSIRDVLMHYCGGIAGAMVVLGCRCSSLCWPALSLLIVGRGYGGIRRCKALCKRQRGAVTFRLLVNRFRWRCVMWLSMRLRIVFAPVNHIAAGVYLGIIRATHPHAKRAVLM